MNAIKYILAAGAITLGAHTAASQYYEIANQLPGLLSPALSGSMAYKGFVELSGSTGFGTNRANFAGISTTQGFQYSDWFFMGVGVGVDVVKAHQPDGWDNDRVPGNDYWDHPSSQTKCMIPVFSDFRFNIGGMQSTSFFIDVKIGASWLIGDSYLQMNTGAMSNNTQFYLKPSMGVRIPVSKDSPKQAIDIGITYQLLTANNNYYYWRSDGVTLNNIGLTLFYEW